MVKRSVLGQANAAQAFATCRREASSCLGKTATRLVIKARRLFPRTATRPVDQNHKLLPSPPLLVVCSPSSPFSRAVLLVCPLPLPLCFSLSLPSSSGLFYLSLLLLPFRFTVSMERISLRLSRLPSPVSSQPMRRPRSGNLRKSTGYQVLMTTLYYAYPHRECLALLARTTAFTRSDPSETFFFLFFFCSLLFIFPSFFFLSFRFCFCFYLYRDLSSVYYGVFVKYKLGCRERFDARGGFDTVEGSISRF